MMIGRVFAVVLVVVPVAGTASILTPWEETQHECVERKAVQIVARGINVVDVPVVARMIGEDLCLHTMKNMIDELSGKGSATWSQLRVEEYRQIAIEVLAKIARKALLKEMGLAD